MKLKITTLLLILLSVVSYSQRDTDAPAVGSCPSFSPTNGTYIVSAWIKEEFKKRITIGDDPKLGENSVINYSDKVGVKIVFFNGLMPIASTPLFTATGNIIDGWQRIVGEFRIPKGATVQVQLVNDNDLADAYFDDVRVFPYNGNIKSFVYDKDTQRLMAELDENNYATFYEYDNEGGLVRVKKETEEGIYTIQETRSGTTKK